MSGKNLCLKLSLAVGALLLCGATSLSAQQIISCSSDDGHRHYCQANTRHADVRMVKQRSDARCQEGYSWGHDRHGIWVDPAAVPILKLLGAGVTTTETMGMATMDTATMDMATMEIETITTIVVRVCRPSPVPPTMEIVTTAPPTRAGAFVCTSN